MTAETDKLSMATQTLAGLVAKAGRVADKLNANMAPLDNVLDHLDARADEMGNVHTQLVKILGQVSNLPPS